MLAQYAILVRRQCHRVFIGDAVPPVILEDITRGGRTELKTEDLRT